MAIAVVAETDVVLPADHQVGLLAGRFGGRRHQHHRAQLGAAAPRRLGRQLSDARRALELLRPPEPQRKSFFFSSVCHTVPHSRVSFFLHRTFQVSTSHRLLLAELAQRFEKGGQHCDQTALGHLLWDLHVTANASRLWYVANGTASMSDR